MWMGLRLRLLSLPVYKAHQAVCVVHVEGVFMLEGGPRDSGWEASVQPSRAAMQATSTLCLLLALLAASSRP